MDAVRKKKLIDIALIALSVVILLAVALMAYLMTRDRRIIKVDISSGEAQDVVFDDLVLFPGESTGYKLLLCGKYSDEYQITLEFKDNEPDKTLKDHAYIRMEKGDEILCDALLRDVLEGDGIVFTAFLTEGEAETISVIYYMPEDVGNEAQNAEADFTLMITASNEQEIMR